MIDFETILEAYLDCRKRKRSTVGATEFELDYVHNLVELMNEVNSRQYKIGKSICFVVRYPRYREVFAGEFRDRIIHHYIALRLEPLFEQIFCDRTYNCRKGKGQLAGVTQLAEDIREESENYTKDAYVMKVDLKGFFMSIPREELAGKVDAFILDNYKGDDIEDLRYLSRVTIMNDPTKNCIKRSSEEAMAKVPKGKTLRGAEKNHGLPIGNLTSQHDANFWLNDFDWMLEIILHIYHHGRYVDDFFLIHKDKRVLLASVPKIREYLDNIGVTLHPRKIELQSVYKGIKFTGMVVKRDRIYASNRMVSNFKQLVHHMNTLPDNYTIEELQHYICSINSYLGLMKHCDSYDTRKSIMLEMDLRFYKHLYIKGHYECVCIKNKYKRDIINRKKLKKRNSKYFDSLMDNYYESDKRKNARENPDREGNQPASR